MSIFSTWTTNAVRIETKCCFHCGGRNSKLMKCGKCKVARYCAKECQKNGWKRHKQECSLLQMVQGENIDELLEVYEEDIIETHIMKQRQAIGTTWLEDPQIAKMNFPNKEKGKDYKNVRRFPDTLRNIWEVAPVEWRKGVIKKSKNALVGSVNHQVVEGKVPLGACPMSWIPQLVPEVEDPELISNPDRVVRLFEMIVRGVELDEDFCPGNVVEKAMNAKRTDAGPLNQLRGMPDLLKRAKCFYNLLRRRWVVEFTFTIMIHVMAYLSGRRMVDKKKLSKAAAKIPKEVRIPQKPTVKKDRGGGITTIVRPIDTHSCGQTVADEKEDDHTTLDDDEPELHKGHSVFDDDADEQKESEPPSGHKSEPPNKMKLTAKERAFFAGLDASKVDKDVGPTKEDFKDFLKELQKSKSTKENVAEKKQGYKGRAKKATQAGTKEPE